MRRLLSSYNNKSSESILCSNTWSCCFAIYKRWMFWKGDCYWKGGKWRIYWYSSSGTSCRFQCPLFYK